MLGSTIIEINGVFLGAAILVSESGTRRFYAAHDSVRALHNELLPDLVALQQRIRLHVRRPAYQLA